MAIYFGWASDFFRMVTVSVPLLVVAVTQSASSR